MLEGRRTGASCCGCWRARRLFAAAGIPAIPRERRIAQLIRESRGFARISDRIDFISRALSGTRYRADTLVGVRMSRKNPWRATTPSIA